MPGSVPKSDGVAGTAGYSLLKSILSFGWLTQATFPKHVPLNEMPIVRHRPLIRVEQFGFGQCQKAQLDVHHSSGML